jgi:curli biogenesis system outer membrane secretion channel CsgG
MIEMKKIPRHGRQWAPLMMALLLITAGSDVFADPLKKTIAVSRFEDKAGARVGDGMADMLTDSLIQSGRFVVLERQTLEDVIGEQDLAASGRAAESQSAQTGKLVSAQILIKGAITEFESESGSSGSGISFGGISIGSRSTRAHVAVVLRIIDTTTGEALDSTRVEGKAEASGIDLGVDIGGVGFGTEGFEKTPLGKATQIAIDNAVIKIVNRLESVPIQGRIIKVSGKDIYTNLGIRNGAVVGQVFNVYSPGEELIDPGTGENLGSEMIKRGSIKIAAVKEKFSKAEPVSGELFETGFILKEP